MDEEIISHLERFVRFRSVEGQEEEKQACLEWIAKEFFGERILWRREKAQTTPHLLTGVVHNAPYLFLPHPHPKLLWFAHIDVVPATDEQFTLMRNGDKLIGRGTSDMKGNQLPFLMAYRDARARGEDPPISILLTSDEETVGPTIPTLLKESKLGHAPCAFTPDTGPRIVIEHKGVVWANLTCHGTGCHGAYPWRGENPIHLLSSALQKIREAFPPGTESDWRLTVTPTQLSGSTARNQVPSQAVCGLDVRYPPEECTSPQEALARIQAVLPPECEVAELLSADPLKTDPAHPMVQRLKNIAERVLGEKVPIEREHGGTDARYFSAHGIPAFLYGPKGEGLHSAHEWVSLQSLKQHYTIARRLLEALSA